MMFSWGKTPEERMLAEVESELAEYQRRCEALREEFRRRLRIRDETRAALSEADGRVGEVQMEGVALLGRLNAAMSEGNEEKVRELERDCKRNSRNLVRVQRSREAAAQKLESVELDEKEAARELERAVLEVLDEYARRVEERKRWLAGVAETLDAKRAELNETAAPLIAENQPIRPAEESSEAERSEAEGPEGPSREKS
jgi:hypothetical protein